MIFATTILKNTERQTRHFAVTRHVPYTNVWDFKPVQWYPGKHPCEKPLDLMKHIVEASSRPGETVLDGDGLPGIGKGVCGE